MRLVREVRRCQGFPIPHRRGDGRTRHPGGRHLLSLTITPPRSPAGPLAGAGADLTADLRAATPDEARHARVRGADGVPKPTDSAKPESAHRRFDHAGRSSLSAGTLIVPACCKSSSANRRRGPLRAEPVFPDVSTPRKPRSTNARGDRHHRSHGRRSHWTAEQRPPGIRTDHPRGAFDIGRRRPRRSLGSPLTGIGCEVAAVDRGAAGSAPSHGRVDRAHNRRRKDRRATPSAGAE